MKRLQNSECCILHCGTTSYSFVRAHAYARNVCVMRAWCVRDDCVMRAWCVRVRFYSRNWVSSCFSILSLRVRSQMSLTVQYPYCDTASFIMKCFVLLVLLRLQLSIGLIKKHIGLRFCSCTTHLSIFHKKAHPQKKEKKKRKKKDQLPLNATRQFFIQLKCQPIFFQTRLFF